jgi:hypothetical protein
MRLYFTAQASENLKAVCKVEFDDVWGNGRGGTVSADGGSFARADAPGGTGREPSANSGFEIKNAYINFNIPNSPLGAMVGILPAKIGSGLVFNDDTSGIVLSGKFDPVKAALVYSRLNDNAQVSGAASIANTVNPATPLKSGDNVDLWAGQLSFLPTKELGLTLGGSWVHSQVQNAATSNLDLDLYNAVLDVDFKTDVFSVYFTGGMNFGTQQVPDTTTASPSDKADQDFTGYLISAGAAVNVQPVVIGVDFYYTPGNKTSDTATDDVKSYVTPGVDGRNTYFMDEIVFPGMFDDVFSTYQNLVFPTGQAQANNISSTGLTRTNAGYTLTNIWAIGAHVDFKPLDQTLLQFGGAYMGLVEKRFTDNATDPTNTKEDDTIGTSLYLRLTQGIVDGLQLKAAFGYLIPRQAYTAWHNDDDAYKFATGLFWSW